MLAMVEPPKRKPIAQPAAVSSAPPPPIMPWHASCDDDDGDDDGDDRQLTGCFDLPEPASLPAMPANATAAPRGLRMLHLPPVALVLAIVLALALALGARGSVSETFPDG